MAGFRNSKLADYLRTECCTKNYCKITFKFKKDGVGLNVVSKKWDIMLHLNILEYVGATLWQAGTFLGGMAGTIYGYRF